MKFLANLATLVALSFLCVSPYFVQAQNRDTTSNKPLSTNTTPTTSSASTKKWYESFAIRGYVQARYNRLLETNPQLKCEQCDRSWGDNGGFFLRRLRVIIQGNVHERVFVYIQPDFASSASATGLHFGQVRDAYFDVALDKKKEFRLRFGQSKIPFGFENMQSSQNRLPLDRSDPINSPVSNERDMGTFFYYAPAKIRERFAYLVSSGLKGSGDYGVFALGAYNGQTANRPEVNNNLHVVSRLTYPFELKNGQIIEAGIQAYTGKVIVTPSSSSVKGTPKYEYTDQRAAASIMIYPQPFGFCAEYNVGTGPEYNRATKTIDQRPLEGGFAQIMYMKKFGSQVLIPFSRYQYYSGGKKHETDARSYGVNDLEIGAEWQPNKNFELVVMYTISSRRFEDNLVPINVQQGNLLRIQAQCNF
jgi:Phosphate-selective porin O and P